MNYGVGAGWDGEVVYVEEPVYYDWECPDGYTRDDWGQCVPEVREVFVIEREILYLYPDLVATYPDLQLHPEFLFRYRPELRTRYANVRSVSELRNRYTQVHRTAPPQRPASAPPAHGGGGKAQHSAKTPGAQPSKHAQPPAHGQPSAYGQPAQQPSAKSPAAPPAHGAPAMPPSTQSPAQHAALTSPTPSSPHAQPPSPSAPKDKTVTSGLFADTKSSHYVGGALVGAVLGFILADDDESRLKLPIAFAACGAIVGGIIGARAGTRMLPRVGYYVPGLFPETREWLENE